MHRLAPTPIAPWLRTHRLLRPSLSIRFSCSSTDNQAPEHETQTKATPEPHDDSPVIQDDLPRPPVIQDHSPRSPVIQDDLPRPPVIQDHSPRSPVILAAQDLSSSEDHSPSAQARTPSAISTTASVANEESGVSLASVDNRWNTESRKLQNLQRIAQLQAKLHEQNPSLPASYSDLEAKIAKQQQLVDQLAERKQNHSTSTPETLPPKSFSKPNHPRSSHNNNRLRPSSQQSPQGSHTQQSSQSPVPNRQRVPGATRPLKQSSQISHSHQSEQLREPDQQSEEQPQPQSQPTNIQIDNYEEHISKLVDDTHSLNQVGQAYLEMVARSNRPTNAEFYSRVINALLSPVVQDTSLALRVLEDARSLGLATDSMYSAVLQNANINHPGVARIATELQESSPNLADSTVALLKEFSDHRTLAQLHIYSTYKNRSDVQWRKSADYIVPRSTAAELEHEFRMLLYMMEANGDFAGCRSVFQYLLERGIAFPDVNVCEYILTSAIRAKDIRFAEWFIHIMAARLGVTEAMYSRVAQLQCQLKDFAGSIKTFAAIRSKGLVPSSDSLRTQLTALAQIGDLKGFAEESAALREHQSNLFTLTSLKLLSVLSKRGSYPDLARLLALTEGLLRPDFRYYATMLHIAAHIDDHERFYSLLAEMRAAGIVPHISAFNDLLMSMQRTGRVELDRLLDTIRAHGLVPDANLLARLAILQGAQQGPSTARERPNGALTAPLPSRPPMENRPHNSAPSTDRDLKSEVFAMLRAAEKLGIENALNQLDQRKVLDLTFYNALLEGFSRKENLAACREIMRKMEVQGIRANATSYNFVLAATKNPRVDEYRRVLEEMKTKGVTPNERTYNGFLLLLSKRRHWVDFDRVLDEMRTANVKPNISTHSIVLNSTALRGDLAACQQAAENLRKIGPLGPSAYTSLIMAACASGALDQANQFVAEMIANGVHPEVLAYNKIMQVCEKRGAAKECWRLLDEMIRVGVKRNMESYATVVRTVLNQVGNDGKDMPAILWDFSKWVLNDMKTQGMTPDMAVLGPIAAYMAKMGELAHFKEVLQWMQDCNVTPDANTLSTLVKQLAARQEYDSAREVIREMKMLSMKPAGVAIAALLNAMVDAEQWDACKSFIQEFKQGDETSDVVALCEKIFAAGKQSDTLERAKLTALLQATNKIV